METGALAPYERSLSSGAPLHLRHTDGRVVRLEVERWLAAADDVDARVLARATSPVLDVGCGPGRILRAAGDLGLFAVGVDIARTAVDLATARGQNVLHRDVHAALPGAGRWGTVLLLDGNIGIGGDPVRLLRRCAALVRAGGAVLVETDPDRSCDDIGLVQFTTHGDAVGPPFRWAHVGLDALARAAVRAQLGVAEAWVDSGRSFAALRG